MGFKTFKNGLDAEVEENTERELFLEPGGEDMVGGERESDSQCFTQGR